MKVRITKKNGQLKMGTTMGKNAELVDLLRFLLDVRHMDRLCFVRGLTGLIVKAVILVLNLADNDYKPVVIPLVEIVCKRILKLGPPP